MEKYLHRTGQPIPLWVSRKKECTFYDNFKMNIDKLVKKLDKIEKGNKNVPGREITNDDIYESLHAALDKERGGIIKTFLDQSGRPMEGDKLAKEA